MSREVMQQALEAIRIFREWEMGQDYESDRATVLARAFAAEEALEAALAEQDEPVAWTLTETLKKRETTTSGYLWFSDPENSSWTPLYTHPAPQRHPLTKDSLLYIYNQLPNWGMDMDSLPQGLERFARAVEAAHGIGEQK